MPKRLALQLIVSLTIIVVIVVGMSSYINVKTQEKQLLDSIILGADQLSRGITSATWYSMLDDRREAAYQVMEKIAEKQGINRIRIFNREGRVMFSTNPAESNRQYGKEFDACSLCHSTLPPKVNVEVPSRARIFRGADGTRKLAMVTPIYNEPACSRAECHAHPPEMKVLGVLDVDLDLDQIDSELTGIKIRGVGFTLTAIVAIGLFIVFFTKRFVDVPIRRLIEGTRAVSQMQLDHPIEIHSSEELSALAQSFNVMRERLKEAMTELNELNQGLETKVRERTDQLQVAHRKLIQADRLASLGQLAASVAHEINNPISGVLNLSMLMQRILKDTGIPAERLPEFRKYLSQVAAETSRAGRIVADLLAFSRRSKPAASEADLNRVVDTTLSLVDHKLRLINIEIEKHLAEGLPSIVCDAPQIQQVVINLVLNAAESMSGKPKGKVIIRTARTADGVLLEVEDNGEGIQPENLSRIFDPFFTTKEEGKGVGLGLAVVYGIVKSHGGDVEVSSEPKAGTIFRVTLPLVSEESSPERGLSQLGQRA
ncbi:MAG: HAMP domain-containing protein [Acidobacteria bacterium]|nr:MAG: HAMP domain-containing protein [Acidobacteriota bacterium]